MPHQLKLVPRVEGGDRGLANHCIHQFAHILVDGFWNYYRETPAWLKPYKTARAEGGLSLPVIVIARTNDAVGSFDAIVSPLPKTLAEAIAYRSLDREAGRQARAVGDWRGS